MTDPQKLIQSYLEDTLSHIERDELTNWLKADSENLRIFVEANLFEERLRNAVTSHAKREAAEAFALSEEDGFTVKPRTIGRWEHWLSRLWLPLATAFVFAILLTGAWIIHGGRFKPAVATQPIAVVRLTRSVQVPEPMPPLLPGQAIPTGRLVLLSGAIQMVLSNGVTIVFEGPGELELLSAMRALLHSGQAVVRVPDNAQGFRLDTTAAKVVDLGTEFGVKCGPGGATDVQVFDGKVLASSAANNAAFPHRLTAGKATRFSPEQPLPTEIAYSPERFVRRLPDDKPVELDEPASPLFNATRLEEIGISRLKHPLVIDGDLSDWSEAGFFRATRNQVAGEFIEGQMCYDDEFLYIAAHIGDPAPMRNVVDPSTDGELGWRGGGLQVRLSTDPALDWPVQGNAAEYYTMRRLTTDAAQVAKATNSNLVHLTMWHYVPDRKACLHIAYGMDFHGSLVNPSGYRATYRKDTDGRGYTLEYAVPWRLLNASSIPRLGDLLAMSWTAHWSDEGGRLWRGQWVELRNASEPLRIHTWERAATWGRAVFQ